tara:strand:+ start:2381 stop:3055 length:675 start_codon:yes stop_codon:yes gene_type:complete
MIKNLLSIDIDYCLHANDIVDLFDILTSKCVNVDEDKILFSQYHIDVLDLIKKIHHPLSIYNVDLHHDIFYENQTSIAEVKSGVVSSADWVLWCLLNKRVESYTWIKQHNSEEFSEDMLELFNKASNYEDNYGIVDSRNVVFSSKKAFAHKRDENFIKQKPKIFTETRALESLKNLEFDYIFVCLSPDYTPKENFFLYDLCKLGVSRIIKNRNIAKKIREGVEL